MSHLEDQIESKRLQVEAVESQMIHDHTNQLQNVHNTITHLYTCIQWKLFIMDSPKNNTSLYKSLFIKDACVPQTIVYCTI